MQTKLYLSAFLIYTVPHSNGRGMHRPTTVDDPYRSRNDHKFGTDAYHYDHMAQPSNNSQQRQPSHSSAHHQRKSSMSNLPQKYYAMVSHLTC